MDFDVRFIFNYEIKVIYNYAWNILKNKIYKYCELNFIIIII